MMEEMNEEIEINLLELFEYLKKEIRKDYHCSTGLYDYISGYNYLCYS